MTQAKEDEYGGLGLILITPLLGGLYFFGCQIYTYLKFGFWQKYPLYWALKKYILSKDTIQWLESPYYVEWDGIRKILIYLADTPLSLSLILINVALWWIVSLVIAKKK